MCMHIYLYIYVYVCIYNLEVFLTMNQYKEVVVSMNLNHVEKEVQEPRHISALGGNILSAV